MPRIGRYVAMIGMQSHGAGLEFVGMSFAFRNASESVLRDVVSAVKMNAVGATGAIVQGDPEAIAHRCAHDRTGHRSAVRPRRDVLPVGNLERGFDHR